MFDYIENLKKQSLTVIDRQRNGITSHRILKLGEKEVTIEVPPILSKTGSITFSISDTSGLQVGDYLDYQFSYTAHGGRTSSYQANYLGLTPPQFRPKAV